MLRRLEVRTDYEAVVLGAVRRGPAACGLAEFPMRVRTGTPEGAEAGDGTALRLVSVDLWRRSARLGTAQYPRAGDAGGAPGRGRPRR